MGAAGNMQIQARPIAMYNAQTPLLCCNWKSDGSAIFFGGADGIGKMWIPGDSPRVFIVAKHTSPIRKIFWTEQPRPCVVTAALDGTISFWDISNAVNVNNNMGYNPQFNGQPIYTINCPGKIYAMDVRGSLMAVALSNRNVYIYNLMNLNNGPQMLNGVVNKDTHQLTCVKIFANQSGFIVGGSDGRVKVEAIPKVGTSTPFTFKAHREEKQELNIKRTHLFPVNDAAVHPIRTGSLITAGSDGCVHYWDINQRRRLLSYPRQNGPIVACEFNHDGNLFACARSYDWHKGFAGASMYTNDPQAKPAIIIRDSSRS